MKVPGAQDSCRYPITSTNRIAPISSGSVNIQGEGRGGEGRQTLRINDNYGEIARAVAPKVSP